MPVDSSFYTQRVLEIGLVHWPGTLAWYIGLVHKLKELGRQLNLMHQRMRI